MNAVDRALGFFHHAVHQVGRVNNAGDCANALACWHKFLFHIHLGANGVAQVVNACLHRSNCLLRKPLQRFWMLFKLVRPVVAHHAAGFARVAASNHGSVFQRVNQLFFVSIHAARFVCCDKTRANPHAICAQRQRRSQTAPVEQTTSGNHHHLVANCVNHLGHKRHRGNSAGVPAAFGALCNNKVATAFKCGNSVAHLAAHGANQHAALVQAVNDLAWHA